METDLDLDLWTLSATERALVEAKKPDNRLDAAVLLMVFQHVGCFPASVSIIERALIDRLAQQLDVDPGTAGTLQGRSLERLRSEIRLHLGCRRATVADAKSLVDWLRDHAVSDSRNHDRLASSLEAECRTRKIEPPALERVDRIIRSAVRAYEERFYATCVAGLSTRTRARLDALLEAVDDEGRGEDSSSRAILNRLRSDAGRAGINSLRQELDKLDIIRNLELPNNLFDYALPHELELYRQRVAVEAPYELRRHAESVRLTWLAAFTFLRGRTVTDALVDLLVETIHKINARAERRVEHELLEDLRRVTGKQNMLFQLADAALSHPDGIIKDVVYPVVSESTLRALVKEWKASGPIYRTTLRTFIRNSYKSHYRQLTLPIPNRVKSALESKLSGTGIFVAICSA